MTLLDGPWPSEQHAPAREAQPGDSTCAIVVTFRRMPLLMQCLEALESQTRPPDRIIVVDNASGDGTVSAVRERFPDCELIDLPENVGASGGFCAGMMRALEHGHRWLWLMDDDTVPERDALEQLLAARDRAPDEDGRPVILASRVVWKDGTSDHPMNKPWPKKVRGDAQIRASSRGLMPLRSASFVSLLVDGAAVEQHGLPHAHYFIWNDDVEFTARLLRDGTGYWVPGSVARHLTKELYVPHGSQSDRFYYEVRNKLWMIRGHSWRLREKLVLMRHLEANTRHYLQACRFRPRAVKTVVRGLRDGFRRE
jgi:rhamnopyranosyl-N-acetylglucosaminyl-diphospho-decaprenol beta-1,3/1,4-galactofuranosyltransferase